MFQLKVIWFLVSSTIKSLMCYLTWQAPLTCLLHCTRKQKCTWQQKHVSVVHVNHFYQINISLLLDFQFIGNDKFPFSIFIILCLQFSEQRVWIEQHFPKDTRYQTVLISGENVLQASYIRYVSWKIEHSRSNQQFKIVYLSVCFGFLNSWSNETGAYGFRNNRPN